MLEHGIRTRDKIDAWYQWAATLTVMRTTGIIDPSDSGTPSRSTSRSTSDDR